MANIITMGSGNLFIDLTRVFIDTVEGKRINRKHSEPDTNVAVTRAFLQNVAEILRVEDYREGDYGRDWSGLSTKPGAVIILPRGNSINVEETKAEVKQKIDDAKVAAARLIAEALGLLPADTARRPAAPVI